MKNLLILLFLAWSASLFAQKNIPYTLEDKKTDTYLMNRQPAKLSIQVQNLPAEVKKVKIKYVLVQLGIDFQSEKYGETDSNGKLAITLNQNLPYQQIWLSVGEYAYAGIYVNEGLNVTVDVSKMKNGFIYFSGAGLEFSGKDGAFNTVMNDAVVFKKEEREKLYNSFSNLRNIKEKVSPAQFVFKIDSISKEIMKFTELFTVTHPDYKWAIEDEVLSEIYQQLCLFYSTDGMPAKLYTAVSNHKPHFVSNGSVAYYQWLHYYTKNTNRGSFANHLTLFDKLYGQQKGDILSLFFLKEDRDQFSELYPMIINNLQTRWTKRIAMEELAIASSNQKKIDGLFAAGQKIEDVNIGKPMIKLPFKAELYELDSTTNIESFLQSLKSKNANKALLIDFWATWCAPCLSDLPFSKSLHKDNEDLPIEYVYICTTNASNVNLWKNKVAELELPGTHIFADEKVVTKLKTLMSATSGFPSYVTIDAKGKVNPQAVSRMSSLNRESLKLAVGIN